MQGSCEEESVSCAYNACVPKVPDRPKKRSRQKGALFFHLPQFSAQTTETGLLTEQSQHKASEQQEIADIGNLHTERS